MYEYDLQPRKEVKKLTIWMEGSVFSRVMIGECKTFKIFFYEKKK